ncbi:hypothetical protein POVWA2_086130 [Plasmodium ovale wallikeri]|uniref:Plasmodium RESA N-terminal domain-containing protein n=2 Tax=Plasmodium ovale TaxID=36330 RepID=A0A1A9AR14_PLAOA|nr:hypothetical protein POVWA1_072980 [Plasmodium ovale wallikeri]SBT58653.1 hypothetical protein POVWA2_086130 [Plasmodium ovale wallikeri]SBT76549.1 Plasmodium exported protein, unknown function [Plasmodium ovale]
MVFIQSWNSYLCGNYLCKLITKTEKNNCSFTQPGDVKNGDVKRIHRNTIASVFFRAILLSLLLFVLQGSSNGMREEKCIDLQGKKGNARMLIGCEESFKCANTMESDVRIKEADMEEEDVEDDNGKDDNEEEEEEEKEKDEEKEEEEKGEEKENEEKMNEKKKGEEKANEKKANKEKKEEEVVNPNDPEYLDKMWKIELEKWRSDIYDIKKSTYWEFKKVCVINNVNFMWENEIWKKYRDGIYKSIHIKQLQDFSEFIALKNQNPTYEQSCAFILEKKNSFKEFCDNLAKEKDVLIDNVIKEWMQFRTELINKMEHKVQKVQKTLKKMKKKKVAQFYAKTEQAS